MMELWTIQEDNGMGWVLLRDAFLTEWEAKDYANYLKEKVLPNANYKIRPIRLAGSYYKPPKPNVKQS